MGWCPRSAHRDDMVNVSLQTIRSILAVAAGDKKATLVQVECLPVETDIRLHERNAPSIPRAKARGFTGRIDKPPGFRIHSYALCYFLSRMTTSVKQCCLCLRKRFLACFTSYSASS